MSDICPICGVKLTMINTGIGGKLKTGEKLCIGCYKKATRANDDFGLHSGRYSLNEAKLFVSNFLTQKEVGVAEASASEETSKQGSKEGKKNGWIGLVIIAVLIYFIFKMCGDSDESKCSKAYVVAKDIVKERLKSPSSAKFNSDCRCVVREDSVWLIKSSVEASNPLGVMLMNDFLVTMKHKGGMLTYRDNWIVIDVKIESR